MQIVNSLTFLPGNDLVSRYVNISLGDSDDCLLFVSCVSRVGVGDDAFFICASRTFPAKFRLCFACFKYSWSDLLDKSGDLWRFWYIGFIEKENYGRCFWDGFQRVACIRLVLCASDSSFGCADKNLESERAEGSDRAHG